MLKQYPVRKADENVYLKEKRHLNPKEIHKNVCTFINDLPYDQGLSICDIGCATGEFLFYLSQVDARLMHLEGVDISEKMLKEAQGTLPQAKFTRASLLDDFSNIFSQKYDIVTCFGVISVCDDLYLPLKNITSILQSKGTAYIFSEFNDDDIDVIMRYRRSNQENNNEWEHGWNIHSMTTVEQILRKLGFSNFKWIDFSLPFSLEKNENDAMRAWTMKLENGQFIQVNGACQIIGQKILVIKRD